MDSLLATGATVTQLLHFVPKLLIDDRFMFTRVPTAFVGHLSEVDAVAENVLAVLAVILYATRHTTITECHALGDWFKNPKAVLEPIIAELNTLKTEPETEVTPEEAESEKLHVDSFLAEREKEREQEADLEASLELEIVNVAPVEAPVITDFDADEDAGLRERLKKYDMDYIRPACPDTAEEARLFRPAIVEALLEFKPASRWEFVEIIPSYLRTGTDAREARQFLQPVLDIVEGYVD